MALLDSTAQPSPPGWAIATAGVVAALLDKLVENGTISGADVGNPERCSRLSEGYGPRRRA
jgi:hypothetical protein